MRTEREIRGSLLVRLSPSSSQSPSRLSTPLARAGVPLFRNPLCPRMRVKHHLESSSSRIVKRAREKKQRGRTVARAFFSLCPPRHVEIKLGKKESKTPEDSLSLLILNSPARQGGDFSARHPGRKESERERGKRERKEGERKAKKRTVNEGASEKKKKQNRKKAASAPQRLPSLRMSALLTPASIEADCATLVESLSTLLRCARVSSNSTGGEEESNKPSSTSSITPALVPAVVERLIASAASLAGAAAELRRRAALADVSRRVAAVRSSRKRLGSAAESVQRELDAIANEIAEVVTVSFFRFFLFQPRPRPPPQRFHLLTLPSPITLSTTGPRPPPGLLGAPPGPARVAAGVQSRRTGKGKRGRAAR